MHRPDPTLRDVALPDLVARALAADAAAWTALVLRLERLVWRHINQFDLSKSNKDEVFARTMLRLSEKLRDVRDPARLPGWIATTTRNEALGLFKEEARQARIGQRSSVETEPGDHEHRIVGDELEEAIRAAFSQLEPKEQQLLEALAGDPPMSYDDISVLFSMPVSSIGPTRQRYLRKLRSMAPLAGYLSGVEG